MSTQTKLGEHVSTIFQTVCHLATESPDGMVYEGSLVDLFKTVDVPMGQYTNVRRVLFDSGCLVMIKRGTRAGPSVIQIVRTPLPEDLTLGSEAGRVAVSADELNARIERLEVWRESFGGMNVVEALRNIEKRLTKIEARLTKVTQ